MQPAKPKLKTAPSPEALAEKQIATERLLKLGEWVDEPNNQKPTNPANAQKSPAVVVVTPVMPDKPWKVPGADKAHPYNIVCTEALFQKMDFVWKRNNNKSLREWVLKTLESEANRALEALGEK